MTKAEIDTANVHMAALYKLSMERIARASSTVLISGESGTGKERMANVLHNYSQRSGKPFIKVNCAALPEGILESELFGHEKGAFTGAMAQRAGRFEMAHTGTIFLDEIADLTPLVQAKLLRVLQEREFERVGGMKTIKVDVRIVAATNKSLAQEVHTGRFREDLFFRLNVITIEIPPLRERIEDIPLLASKFLHKFSRQNQRTGMKISPEVMDCLISYSWRGNVRELENLIERLTVLAPADTITIEDLPQEILNADPIVSAKPSSDLREFKTLRQARADFEKDLIEQTLQSCNGNVTASSAILGIARKNLQEKIRKYSIDIQRFRGQHTDTEA